MDTHPYFMGVKFISIDKAYFVSGYYGQTAFFR